MPTDLDKTDRKIIKLEIELISLESDSDDDFDPDAFSYTATKSRESMKRVSKIRDQLADLREKSEDLTSRWAKQKLSLDRIKEVKEEIAKTKQDMEQFEREYNLRRASKLQYDTLPALEQTLSKLTRKGGKSMMLRDEVVEEDISSVLSSWMGIPEQKLSETEQDRIVSIVDKLKEWVIGQDEAVEVIADAVKGSRAGLNDSSKPIASMMFLGPTGVGKTELARALREFKFDTEDAMIRIDMSEYMEKQSVDRLVGVPPGYVGYDEGGQLTGAVRRKPYSVLLFDEIEKAHPDVFNLFLQMLDDGRVTDGKRNVVAFKNCIVLFTSNIGSQAILGAVEQEDKEEMEKTISYLMQNHFKPEFLDRIDENVIFNSLTREDLHEIIQLEVKRVEKRLEDRGMKMMVTAEVLDHLKELELETVLAKGILNGKYGNGDTVIVDALDDENDLVVTKGIPNNKKGAVEVGSFD